MDSLVSTDWLGARLGDDPLLILDASHHLAAAGRDARTEFASAHIPGAQFLDLASFSDAHSPVPNALPTGAQVADRLARIGWEPGQDIVIYDDSAIKTSARAWLALARAGIASSILDGGLETWRAEGRPLATGAPVAAEPSQLREPSIEKDRTRTMEAMLANLETRTEQVIDARDADRFTGAARDMVHDLPGGHIPGARHLWYRDLYRPDGTFKPEGELRALFDAAGVDLSRPIVTTCGSGVTASVLLFALHRLGIRDAALYEGSWSEWGADDTSPKAVGPA